MTTHRNGPQAGEMFGPYQLQSLLGQGGMGEVYRAYDTVKDRVVAVKVLRREFAADPAFQERFRRESRVAARLQEPHVIPVHDFGEINGALFIDMRLVEGSDLRSVLGRGPLAPARATWIVSQVAAALDAAHADDLVHRDVKPENVLLTPNDFAYLVDFGIAYVGAQTGLTSAGGAVGSTAYMAPERFTEGQSSTGADVYALACVLYECLTGQPPFPGGDLPQLLSAHILTPPPKPGATRPGLAGFDGVIAWGMAKDPAARCPSAGELARAARSVAVAAQSPAAIRPEVGARPWPTTAPTLPWSAPGVSDPGVGAGQPAIPVQRGGSRRGLWALAAMAFVLLTAGAGIVVWLAVGRDRQPATPVASGGVVTTVSTVSVPPTPAPQIASTPTPTPRPQVSLPGTDAQGFLAYPGARCDPGDAPAVLALTTQSALAICSRGPGSFYYRGVRLSDNATIELANAVRSSGSFDVTNPADGTRYSVRPTALTITTPNGQVYTEPMVQYASI
jgi:serine/threonine-protein kinase